ncbi:2'-5' RNA ligase family protein [Rhodococcoides yunnanense]|uniref:2'-5' RNA ligase family protein n=1 Tax=Rhodococcoides yunnanense TaxID=278209 RepID=UPI0009333F7A|nr:2'-5' RNA ligase family protein [Rhodococcus yunnanensis]
MVQSVELLLDDALDAAVRAEWQVLVDADLPSQGRHRGESNRPHVTVSVADEFEELDRGIASTPLAVLFPIRLGPFVVFRGKHATLARLVIPSRDLLSLHDAVSSLAGTSHGLRAHTAPGHWTPHVTLARRLTEAELAAALRRLDSVPAVLTGATVALRRWDGERKVEWPVG